MSDLQLIDELCDICAQLAGIVRKQSELLAQDAAVDAVLGRMDAITSNKM